MTAEQVLRLENEQREIETRINKLEKFMISDTFDSLCDLQKSLLIQQYNAMCSYNNILCLRCRILHLNVSSNAERLESIK